MKSRFAVEKPRDAVAEVARERQRLQEHLGQHHRRADVQVDAAAAEPRHLGREQAEVEVAWRGRARPGRRPGARGRCRCRSRRGPSPAGRAATRRRAGSAPGGARAGGARTGSARRTRRGRARRGRPRRPPGPAPRRSRAPCRTRPCRGRPATSSEVAPATASSKSCTMPAPFSAIPVTKPRSMRSIRTGERPDLDHVRAQAPHDRPALVAGPHDRVAQLAQRLARQDPRQAGEERGERAAAPVRPRRAASGCTLLCASRERVGA